MSFIATFPYFTNAAIMFALCLVAIGTFPRQRRIALQSAFLSLPWGVWGIALVPEYWTPRLVFRFGKLGPEDFIWAFATGGLAWICAAELSRRQWQTCGSVRGAVARYGFIAAVGALVFVPMWLGNAGVMSAFVASNSAVAAFLLFKQPTQWRLAVGGAIGLGLLNAVVMKLNLLLCPNYYEQMPAGALSGFTIWGLPFEELIWAVSTGTVWPLVVAYVLELKPGGESRCTN